MRAAVSWCLDKNTELLANILAVIIMFINKEVLYKNTVIVKKQPTAFSIFALLLCHIVFLSP